jgi:hypothetical protein
LYQPKVPRPANPTPPANQINDRRLEMVAAFSGVTSRSGAFHGWLIVETPLAEKQTPHQNSRFPLVETIGCPIVFLLSTPSQGAQPQEPPAMTDRFSHRPKAPASDPTDNADFWFNEDNTPWRPSRPRRGLFGSARLARREDLAGFLEPVDNGRPRSKLPLYAALVESSADGGTLEPILYPSLSLPEDLRTRHLLAIGQTGCGKTTRLIYPLLANDVAQRRSIIVFDAKGKKVLPLVEGLAELHRPGQKTHLLNFRDPARSLRWNPIQGIRTEGEAHDVAYKICTLVDRGSEREGAFWLNNSIDALSGILLALATDPKERPSLSRARQVAHLPVAEFSRFAQAHPSVGVLTRVVELYRDANTTGACVLQDLRMRLSSFMDERVCDTTDVGPNQISVDRILTEGGILVVEVNETDVGKLKQIINLFMNHLFSRLISLAADARGGRLPLPCSLFLDEFASAVGKTDEMEVRLNTVRERGVSVVAAIQSIAQLSIYGNSANQVLAGFASKVYFAGLEWGDAEYASRQAGITTVYAPTQEEDEDEEPWLRRPVRGVPAPRSLLLPEEIARPTNHPTFGPPATLFLADTPPVQVYLRPAYDLPVLSRLLDPDEVPETKTPIKRRIAALERKLHWSSATQPTRQWWAGFKEKHSSEEVVKLLEKLEPLLEAWQKLREPKSAMLDAFRAAVQESGSKQAATHLAFLQYQLLKRHEEEQMGLETSGPG